MVEETPLEHVEAHEHRQEVGDARHKRVEDRADLSDIRQDDSDTRQDKSDTRQDVSAHRQDIGEAVVAKNTRQINQGQNQQDVTNLITNAHTEQIQGMQAEAAVDRATQTEQGFHLDRITEGVDFLAVQVTTLNERVYTKNYLDRIRNYMLGGAIITFVVVSLLLGYTLFTIKVESSRESDRAATRASEAISARKQIADCTVSPGTLLEDGTINPGECYKRNQEQTNKYLESLVSNITEEIRKLLVIQSEAAATNIELSKAIRDSAAAQAKALKTTSTSIVLASTTSTTQIPPPPPTSPPPTKSQEPGLVCSVLSVLGLCDA